MLERLSLIIVLDHGEEEYNFNIPTLKRLNLVLHSKFGSVNKVVLNLPNLQYLLFGGRFSCPFFVVENLSSLVEASFPLININHLVKGISGDKSLSWSTNDEVSLSTLQYIAFFFLTL